MKLPEELTKQGYTDPTILCVAIVRHCAAVCLARSFTGSLATRGTAADLYLEILKEFGLEEKDGRS